MLRKTVQPALNERTNREYFSFEFYLSMAASCEGKNPRGFTKWLKVQSAGETKHGMKISGYIFDRNGTIMLHGIDQPLADFTSPAELFRQALEHQQKATASMTKLFELSNEDNDYPAQIVLQRFNKEQGEEDKTTIGIAEQLRPSAILP